VIISATRSAIVVREIIGARGTTSVARGRFVQLDHDAMSLAFLTFEHVAHATLPAAAPVRTRASFAAADRRIALFRFADDTVSAASSGIAFVVSGRAIVSNGCVARLAAIRARRTASRARFDEIGIVDLATRAPEHSEKGANACGVMPTTG
jgi:hypothetical protein